MATENQVEPIGRPAPRSVPTWGRRFGLRFVVAVAALVLAVFVALGVLPVLYALAGFVAIAAAAVVATERGAGSSALTVDDAPARAQEQLIDAVIASLPDAAIVLGREARVIAFNSGARKIAPALTRGVPASLALRVPEIVEAVREVAAGGLSRSVEFYQRVPIDRWFKVYVEPVGAPRPVAMMLLVFQDLTPLHRAEQMRADFVANASHELRTPLAALSGFIDTLLGPARDDPQARERFLAIMKTQAARMARLIDDLLSLSRIELVEHMHPDTPVDLVPVVRQVVDGLQTLATDRNVEIAIAPPAAPTIVPGDRDELTRVFENLVENALKYGASGKRVDVGFSSVNASDGSPEVLIAVRDYGPGIAAEHLPRLTERFYRVDVTQSRAEGGTGLGLALVKHILNRHRGKLSIESGAGHGATFTVRLPLVHSPPAG
jgi:two-component system, OmpR family, phosphate regulon sensor histidine kinase PhoR